MRENILHIFITQEKDNVLFLQNLGKDSYFISQIICCILYYVLLALNPYMLMDLRR